MLVTDQILPELYPAPTLVQHLASGIDRFDCGTLNLTMPNKVLAGNCLIMGLQLSSTGDDVNTVTDDKGNTWVAGPTTTNSTYSRKLRIYYVLNAIADTQAITVTFLSANSTNVYPQACVSEFNNIMVSSASDGSSSSSNSQTAGSITTTADGDLIYQYGCALSTTSSTGGGFNGTSITKGSGFTLLNADLQVGVVAQFQIQAAAGAINPAFTSSGSDTWGTLAIALKSSLAGTLPSTSSLRIVHLQHILLSSVNVQGRSSRIVMQFPSTGNLLVGSWDSGQGVPTITSVTDNFSNTWSIPGGGRRKTPTSSAQAQIFYATGAKTSTDLSGITVTADVAGTGDEMLLLYDIANAPTTPVDQFGYNSGTQSVNAALAMGTITPTRAGLTINSGAWDTHTCNSMTTPSGGVLDSVWNDKDDNGSGSGGTTPSTLDMDNPRGHYYNPDNSALTFTYNYNPFLSSVTGVGGWASVSVSFANTNPSANNLGTQIWADSFARPDESPIAGNWATTSGTPFTISSGKAQPGGTSSDRHAIWVPWASGNDQYSQVEVTESGGATGVGIGVCVRHDPTESVKTMYRLVLNGSGGFELAKFITGTFTSLRTGSVTYSAGTKLGLSIQGTTLKIWYGGVQQGTNVTDSAISSGIPGLAYSSTATSASCDNWDAGTVP